MEISQLHQLFLQHKTLSTDTRNIIKGSIFFALKGENFDANAFAKDALEKGASYVVIDDASYYENNSHFILVVDVLKTLQELANFHRNYLKIPIISLTGSNGKTTTKELINVVLSKKYRTVATKGNLNNHLGVPLTLLSMNEETELGIVEMGANHIGEIAVLSQIAAPNYGYITNFGKAHLEGFGSVEGVIQGKSELYDFLRLHDGAAFVNQGDAIQVKQSTDQKRILFETAQLLKNDTEFIAVSYQGQTINTNLVGNYNVNNISAALHIGLYFGVELSDIVEAIESYKPENKRSQLIQKDNYKFILDAYNANPTSMLAALENFSSGSNDQKVVVLGDMFELGIYSEEEHQKIADFVENAGFYKSILIGERFAKTKTTTSKKYKTFEDFKEPFQASEFEQKTLLIKGSRGMALERVLELFVEEK